MIFKKYFLGVIHFAIPREPRFKLLEDLSKCFWEPKALKGGVKRHKLTEYGEQLLEKQNLKAYYGLMEKQFSKYVMDELIARESSVE